MTATELTHDAKGVRLKTIALPAQHGGWGFVLEPIVLGLLLAPSPAGFYLGLSAVGFFLARHPLTLLMLNRKRPSPRNAMARRFAFLYLVIGATSFGAALMFARASFVVPLAIAAPLVILQVAYDWAGRRRVLLPELAGVIAVSSLASAISLGAAWRWSLAFSLWALMIARAIPAILYVRVMLARLHGKSASSLPMFAAHVAAVAVVTLFVSYHLLPPLAILAMLLLTLRALIGFTSMKRVTAKQLGFSEIVFGAIAVFAVVIGKAAGF